MDKKLRLIILIILILAAAIYFFRPAPKPPPPSFAGCDISLWQHVYNPSRLKVIDPCKTVSGIVEYVKTEPDGDLHIRLKLDPQYNDLLTDKNLSEQRGDLVIEAVCEKPIKQKDAVAACQGFQDNLIIPPAGTHVSVTGSFVLDTDHGWNEIHPISRISAS